MKMRIILFAALIGFALGHVFLAPLYGQAEPAPTEKKPVKVEEPAPATTPPAPIKDIRGTARLSLEERLEILEEELERIKLQKGTEKKYESREGMGPAASAVYHSLGGLTWGGYGEAKFIHYKKSGRATRLGCLVQHEENTGKTQGNTEETKECLTDYKNNRARPTDEADMARMILYAGYRFNDWIVLNTEFEYEHAGISGGGATPEVFVEFAYIDLEFMPEFQLALGLHLVPMGITNLMHEPTTFYSVQRSQTESNIIPSTWREMGAMFHGQLFSGAFEYRAGVLNGGRGTRFSDTNWIRGGRTKGSQARADDLAGVASLEFKGLEGLTVGTSYYEGDNGQGEVLVISPLNRYKLINDTNNYLNTYESDIVQDTSDFAKVKVRLAEGHLVYQGGPVSLRGLFARGWMDEGDVRAINASTGKNVGMLVEGGYGEIGLDLFHWASTDQKLVVFVRNEYLNTQKNTAQYGFKDNLIDNFCKNENVKRCRTYDDLNSGKTIGLIEDDIEKAVNTELKKNSYHWRFAGRPDPTQDRRIITGGIAYFPHPQVVFKLDYESWWSASTYHKDIQQRNSANNKIDRVNFGVGFIF